MIMLNGSSSALLMAQKTVLLSQVFIPTELTLSQRQLKLMPFFSPKPGESVKLNEQEIISLRSHKTQNVYGYIDVNAPSPGPCLTITRLKSLEDKEVCKTEKLRFDPLTMLDEKGMFSWKVRTGVHDFGTDLTWKTPYRIARMVKYPDPKEGYVISNLIEKCLSSYLSTGEKKIYLRFLNAVSYTHLRAHET